MNDSQRQSISHAVKAVLSDVKEFDVKFQSGYVRAENRVLSKLYYIKRD